MTGRPSALPRAIGEDAVSCSSGTVGALPPARAMRPPLCPCSRAAGVGGRAREDRRHKAQGGVTKRDWILHKKERARAQGKDGVKQDTK